MGEAHMTLQPWPVEREELIADLGIFAGWLIDTRSPRTGEIRRVTRIDSSDWINIIALTPEEEVLLVRQYRHGTRTFTLEIPGGLIDAGETAEEAALRELREETGYTGSGIRLIGRVAPNPAFLSNHCSTFLVEGCERAGEMAQEEGEDLELVVRPLSDIPALIADGEIVNSLVICAFWWLAQDSPDRFRP
jgi:8-oxo-dGTP pyrophosphatase MutT (NUDIX family)